MVSIIAPLVVVVLAQKLMSATIAVVQPLRKRLISPGSDGIGDPADHRPYVHRRLVFGPLEAPDFRVVGRVSDHGNLTPELSRNWMSQIVERLSDPLGLAHADDGAGDPWIAG